MFRGAMFHFTKTRTVQAKYYVTRKYPYRFDGRKHAASLVVKH
jgi:hypothetical protein